MSQPTKILATLLLGAVSGLGFYSVSSPVTRLSTFATQHFFPSFAESEKGGSSVHKTDRGVALPDVTDEFEDRWPRLSQLSPRGSKSADTRPVQMQITSSNEGCRYAAASWARLMRPGHHPEKHALGLDPRVEAGFPSRQTRNAFARRSCSNKEMRS